MHFSEQKPTPLCGLRAVCPRPSRPSERISSLPCHAPPPGAACESMSESQGFCLGAFSISLCSAQKAPPPAPARSCLPSSWSAQTPPCREDLPWRPSCRYSARALPFCNPPDTPPVAFPQGPRCGARCGQLLLPSRRADFQQVLKRRDSRTPLPCNVPHPRPAQAWSQPWRQWAGWWGLRAPSLPWE